jgi:transcription elongation factor Elf1
MLARLRRLLRHFIYQECPLCHEMAVTWHKVYVHHHDEPPCFGWYECTACHARTEVTHTPLMDEAARSLGFSSFVDFMDAQERKDEQAVAAEADRRGK